jgi:hypothetical protein
MLFENVLGGLETTGGAGFAGPRPKERAMLDVVFVLVTVVFFALCGAWMVFAETL